jgi:hypothetical protein
MRTPPRTSSATGPRARAPIARAGLAALFLALPSCGPRAPIAVAPPIPPATVEAGPPPITAWERETFSPRPANVADPRDAPVAAACEGGLDQGLMRVADQVVRTYAEGGELPDAQTLEYLQRRAGNPHVWARAFGARADGGALDRTKLAADVKEALGDTAPRTRCGLASVRTGDGAQMRETLVMIASEVLADLGAVPTRGRTGAWIDVDATLLSDATAQAGSEGRVVLLPPRGAPRPVIASTTQGTPRHVKARFALVMPGRHVIQVLADDGHGPRPVLEAEIWADVEPSPTAPTGEVPGEAAGDGVADATDALLRRLNGLRATEKLGALARDPVLDRVAQAHAAAMMRAGLLGHDVGDGDPRARIVAAGGGAYRVMGENVARAHSEKAAHRALYASPSHRGNMLDGRFTKVGLGFVANAETGEVWVAQEYGG